MPTKKNKRLAQTKKPDGAVVEREWTPRENYMLFMCGFRHGAGVRALDPDKQGLVAYDRGYKEGMQARGKAGDAFAKEIGYKPTILRAQEKVRCGLCDSGADCPRHPSLGEEKAVPETPFLVEAIKFASENLMYHPRDGWEIPRAAVQKLQEALPPTSDEITRLRNVIRTGGAMYRAERAVMGIPGGYDPTQHRLEPIDVACPACPSTAGEACVRTLREGLPPQVSVWTHDGRIEAMRRQEEREYAAYVHGPEEAASMAHELSHPQADRVLALLVHRVGGHAAMTAADLRRADQYWLRWNDNGHVLEVRAVRDT